MLPVRLSPLVWSMGGRARVIVPAALFARLDCDAQETILAHELAHVRRGDHWVRLLELLVSTLFWWHPVVWWACRQLRDLEEQCCDGLVLNTVPHGPRAYATALMDTLDFLSEYSAAAPVVATAAKSPASVARRIKMLKNHAPVVRLTVGRLLLLSALAAVPMAVAFASAAPQRDDGALSNTEQPIAEPVVQRRIINRLVKDFPAKFDLSTPESALAAWSRSLAGKQILAANELSWVKLDAQVARDVEKALKFDPNAPTDMSEQILNIKIVAVLSYDDDLAVVICKTSGPGERRYCGQPVGRIHGIWKCLAAIDLDPTAPGIFASHTFREAVERFESEKDDLWQQFVRIRDDVINGRTPTIDVKDGVASGGAMNLKITTGRKAASPASPSAADEDIKRWERTTWRMNIGLDVAGLSPQAVQWAIFDQDPVPDFQARVKRMQSYYRKRIEGATDANAKEMERSIGMAVSWDQGFKQITGDRLYLLALGGAHVISSNGPDGKKWIVSKSVRIKGKPACWCIAVEVKTGESIDVWLTEDNAFNLGAAFDEAMRAPDQAK